MGKLIVVVGGQYGSEGKGAVVAHLARQEISPLVIRVGGPNAGHTVHDSRGTRFALRQIPAGVVSEGANLAIAAGSEIDLEVLETEVRALEAAGLDPWGRLLIDPSVTILGSSHRDQGERQRRHGSTGKGVGVARAERVRRWTRVASDAIEEIQRAYGSITMAPVGPQAETVLRQGRTVIVEGTQGYALGLHTRWYPFTTSGDCTALDALAQARISPWVPWVEELEIWVVMRTYPIRVAGDSGPLPQEVDWDILGERSGGHIKPELTTVTNKVRRVGYWDTELAIEAVAANGGSPPVWVALMMFDYWYPDIHGLTELPARRQWRIAHLEQRIGANIGLVGTGPQSIVGWRKRG